MPRFNNLTLTSFVEPGNTEGRNRIENKDKIKVKMKINKTKKFSIGTSSVTVAFLYVLRYTTVGIITL